MMTEIMTELTAIKNLMKSPVSKSYVGLEE